MYSRCVTADVTDALSVYMYWASCLVVDVTDVVWQLNDVLFLDCLQGIRAVIAESYERIHRSNLVGMGIIPMQYQAGVTAESLGLTGTEKFTIEMPKEITCGQLVTVQVRVHVVVDDPLLQLYTCMIANFMTSSVTL